MESDIIKEIRSQFKVLLSGELPELIDKKRLKNTHYRPYISHIAINDTLLGVLNEGQIGELLCGRVTDVNFECFGKYRITAEDESFSKINEFELRVSNLKMKYADKKLEIINKPSLYIVDSSNS